MIKHVSYLVLIGLMALTGLPLTAAPADTSPPDYENTAVEQVMNQYFATLVSGDTASMRALLGGQLLNKRNRLMNNPDYGTSLAEVYTNASFNIQQIRTLNPGQVEVDAVIHLSPVETVGKRYVLEQSDTATAAIPYRIISERSLAE